MILLYYVDQTYVVKVVATLPFSISGCCSLQLLGHVLPERLM